MGLLSEGKPLTWEETKKLCDFIRFHGIQQFIHLYHIHKLKDRKNDSMRLLWGDEVEYTLIHLDKKNRKARLCLRADKILPKLREKEDRNDSDCKSLWRPEYSNFMVEGTPGEPYGNLMAHFNVIEANMRIRRCEVQDVLNSDEVVLCLSCFPRFGCPDFVYPESFPDPQNSLLKSLFVPDTVTFPGHPRFMTLSVNIAARRGKKVIINEPIYKDVNTASPFKEDFSIYGDDGQAENGAKPDHVYMDAMACGMGMACLQVTFQACNIDEARHLYDQLSPLCPIMMALSAASPMRRGYLVDIDTRWSTISQSVDCRTDEELGLKPLKENKFRIPESRFSRIDCYLSALGADYNDVPVVYDEEIYKKLVGADIDHLLAQHIAHLFIRDPISVFKEKLNLDDEQDSDHFENIQSTNWQSMRFKPPPPNSNIGWRVEFRPCDVQLTDFENAAYDVFIVLMTRVMLSFKLNFLIPISKFHANMEVAQKRNAVLNEKFWFRKDIYTSDTPSTCHPCEDSCGQNTCQYALMSINEIINGKEGDFPGLVPLALDFLTTVDVDVDTQCTIQQYLRLIGKRASGELKTFARWSRDFIQNHPDYKRDSVISEEMNYDYIVMCNDIQQGKIGSDGLFDPPSTKTKIDVPDVICKAEQQCKGDNPDLPGC